MPRLTFPVLAALSAGLSLALAVALCNVPARAKSPGSEPDTVAHSSGGAKSPEGVWMTEGGKARIRIEPCGDGLCGRIVWLPKPNNADGTPRRDRKNPNPALRNRPLLGMQILTGFRRDAKKPNRWTGGRIYDAGGGRSYRAVLTIRKDGRLNVRGYVAVPLFGGSQNWTRVPR